MSTRNSTIGQIVLVSCFLCLTGCSKKPEAELTAAETAVSQLETAEAQVYAPEEFQRLNDLFNEAKTELQVQDQKSFLTRSYSSAQQKLVQVEQMAASCLETAKQNREKTRQETEAALAEAEQAVNAAQSALEAAPKGKGTRADLEALKTDLESAKAALEGARQTISSGKYMDAKGQLSAVKSRAEAITQEIEQAIARKSRRS